MEEFLTNLHRAGTKLPYRIDRCRQVLEMALEEGNLLVAKRAAVEALVLEGIVRGHYGRIEEDREEEEEMAFLKGDWVDFGGEIFVFPQTQF